MVGVRNRTRRVICRSVRFALAVRGGVLDAPRSRDCRGGLVASVRPDRQHPRLPRCADIASTAQRIQIPRAQPAHLFKRAHPRNPSTHAGRAWKLAPTRCPEFTHAAINPSVTAHCAATAPLSGEPRWHGATTLSVIPRREGGGFIVCAARLRSHVWAVYMHLGVRVLPEAADYVLEPGLDLVLAQRAVVGEDGVENDVRVRGAVDYAEVVDGYA